MYNDHFYVLRDYVASFFCSKYACCTSMNRIFAKPYCGHASSLFYVILCLPVNLRMEKQFLAWSWTAHWTSLLVHFTPSLLHKLMFSQFLVGTAVLFISTVLHIFLFQYGSLSCVPLSHERMDFCICFQTYVSETFSEPPVHAGIPMKLSSIPSQCTRKSVVNDWKATASWNEVCRTHFCFCTNEGNN